MLLLRPLAYIEEARHEISHSTEEGSHGRRCPVLREDFHGHCPAVTTEAGAAGSGQRPDARS